MALLLFGATVTGPGHLRDGLPNQDAWTNAAVAGGRVVVVADGLGSRPLADVGAQAACDAVPEALRAWSRHPQAATAVLLGLIHLFWRARLGARDPEQASTTCLFAFLRHDGSGLVGQLGDGLVLLGEGGAVVPIKSREAEGFSNSTQALGATRNLGAWTTRELAPGDRSVVLCTDGVSDDLLPERFPEFVRWLEGDLGPRSPAARRRRLTGALRAWPTPNHIDDKTLALIRRQS